MGHLMRNLNVKKGNNNTVCVYMRRRDEKRRMEKSRIRKETILLWELSTDVQSDSPYYPGKKESYYIIYESFQSHGQYCGRYCHLRYCLSSAVTLS